MAGSPVELIKEKLDIAEFLKGYLELRPAGKNFKALCPFHNEKTPSFMISPERQTWHCFGCSLGGDAFTFLMRYENLEFGEALRVLAERTGVELQRLNSADYKISGLLYDINQAAARYFAEELQKSDEAKKYLAGRGILKETMEEFELGWSPNAPDSLYVHLINKGFYPEDIVRAGLTFKSERGLQIDRFRGRIMFPIHNTMGKVVGFTGRILPRLDDGKMGKYVNSPETPIFNKSKLLYGFFKSKNFIRSDNNVFLVEGQMDFLLSYQAGVKTAVASSGTALTSDHLRVLRRLTDQMTVSFDNDSAGLAAGERAIDLAEANDFNVKVLTLGAFKDPADAVQADPVAFHKHFSEAVPAPEFYFERYLKEFADSPVPSRSADFKRNIRIALEKIKHIASPVLRDLWLREYGKRLGIAEAILGEEMERIEEGAERVPASSDAPRAEARPLSRWEMLSEHLLAAACAKENYAEIKESILYFPEPYQKAFALLASGKHRAPDPALDELLNTISLRSGVAASENMDELKKYLAEEYRRERGGGLLRELQKAEAHGDEESVRLALQKFNTHINNE